MQLISLTQGKFAKVDNADASALNRHKWCAMRNKSTFYAVRITTISGTGKNRKRRLIAMHREILASEKHGIDHKNGNGLDNQRTNLRPANNAENQQNKKRPTHNTSGYKGVSWHKIRQKWRAYISVNKRHISLGYFDTAEEAAKVYDAACTKFFKEFAKPNAA